MKKKLLVLLAIFGILAIIIAPAEVAVYAATDPLAEACKSAPDSAACGSTDTIDGNGGIVSRVTNIIATIGGILAVVMIIVAGAMFIMARGEAGRIKIARETIIYAVIGLVVIMLARFIIMLVIGTA